MNAHVYFEKKMLQSKYLRNKLHVFECRWSHSMSTQLHQKLTVSRSPEYRHTMIERQMNDERIMAGERSLIRVKHAY